MPQGQFSLLSATVLVLDAPVVRQVLNLQRNDISLTAA